MANQPMNNETDVMPAYIDDRAPKTMHEFWLRRGIHQPNNVDNAWEGFSYDPLKMEFVINVKTDAD